MSQKFNSLTAELIHQRNNVHDVCRIFNRTPSKKNLKQLTAIFQHCGDGVFIEQGFYCDYGDKISLGDRVYLNLNCTLLDGGKITIGNDCLIGPNVQILTINHSTSAKERLNKANYASDVLIGDNVWIGAGVIILPGITVGKNSVIGAGSIVSRDIEENHLYLGNPARKIRFLE